MKKTELLTYLIENKAKHDVILATAIAGYWEIASAKVDNKRKQLTESVTDWQTKVNAELDKVQGKISKKESLPIGINLTILNISSDLGLVYPQDHTKEYERAFRMMKSSVYDEVKLTVDEYDAYVLNNWEWKTNFNASNLHYVNAYKRSHNNVMLSGVCHSPVNNTGSWTSADMETYTKANDVAVTSYSNSDNVSL